MGRPGLISVGDGTMIARKWAIDPSLHDPRAAPLTQLRLHDIAPVLHPSAAKSVRDQTPGRPPTSNTVTTTTPRSARGHSHNQQRTREQSVVSSAAIFSSSLKRASHFGAVTLHHPNRHKPHTAASTHDASHLLHNRKEPIDFDPFTDAPCYQWLIQDPSWSRATQQYRQDAGHLASFRQWMETHFSRVVDTFRSLQMLHHRPTRRVSPPTSSADSTDAVNQPATRDRQHSDDEETDDEDDTDERASVEVQRRRELVFQRRQAQQRAWQVLFEDARLVSYPPGETFCIQDVTPAHDVFFILSGHCDLLFQPKFLDHLVQQRNERRPNHENSHDSSSSVSSPSDMAMRRLSLSTITTSEAADAMARTLYPMRTLTSGECFGLEACAFAFAQHTLSAISQGAVHRNSIGVATPACLHVLVLPFSSLQRMRDIIHSSLTLPVTAEHQPAIATPTAADPILSPRRRGPRTTGKSEPAASATAAKPPALPPLPGCRFRDEDVEFLRHTFMFQSIQLHRLEYLATQVRVIHVPKHEYLFTTGQHVAIYLVKSGQLRVHSPEQVKMHEASEEDEANADRDGERPLFTVETRNVELEILQIHDTIGLMEASLLQPTFSTNCLASSDDVAVYVIPPVALFTVLVHEPTASRHVIDNLLCHHSWYKARKFTALNHHNKQTEFRLSLGTQRKSPLPCSRCGWRGHTSTSSLCVRAASAKSAFIQHLVGDDADRLPSPTAASSHKGSVIITRGQRAMRGSNRSGSTVMMASPPRMGSTARIGTRANGSLLPGIVGLAAMLDAAAYGDNTNDTSSALIGGAEVSELEKSLVRLDAALGVGPPVNPPVRPATQQSPRSLYRDPQPRNSVFVLRDETLRAVARISTAVTATASLPSPRAIRVRGALSEH